MTRIKKAQEFSNLFSPSSLKTSKDQTIFLILAVISQGCLKLIDSARGVMESSGDSEGKFLMYKMEFATSVTCDYFIELTKAMEACIETLNAPKTLDNLVNQYHVFFTMNAVNAAMISLNTLGIPLSTVLYEKSDFEYFMRIFEQTTMHIISGHFEDKIDKSD
jgi:hypothetical protein